MAGSRMQILVGKGTRLRVKGLAVGGPFRPSQHVSNGELGEEKDEKLVNDVVGGYSVYQ